METNMNKKSKIVLALILVIVLFTSVLSPVASAYPYSRAAITKMLKVPVGTNLPIGNFQYVITPVSINYSSAQLPPVVGTGTATIAMPSQVGDCACATPCATDVVHYYRESDELFGNVNWPHPGVFEYRIVETPNTIPNLQVGENMIYSPAVYIVRVFVRADGAGRLYVYNVAAYRDVEHDGTVPDDPEKVDPTPGGDGERYFYSQMAFQNIYTKHTGGNGTDPANRYTLGVYKLVEGDYSNPNQYFNFTMTVTRPSLITEPTTVYKAYVVEGNATFGLLNLANNGLAAAGTDAGGVYANITSGQSFTFRLRHNQRLSFTNTHVGSSYTVGETGVPWYTPRVIITTNGINGPQLIGYDGMNLMVPTAGSVYPTNPLVGEGINANRAVFTNTNYIDDEMGLNFSDLPFYGLILLALAGVVVLTITKTRSRKRY